MMNKKGKKKWIKSNILWISLWKTVEYCGKVKNEKNIKNIIEIVE